MRFAAWAVIGAFAVGAAFLAYLTWAFTPKKIPAEPNPNGPRVIAQGAAGERLFYQIVAWRDKGDAIYDVYLSPLEKPPQDQRGDLVLRTIEWPVPLRVSLVDSKTAEVELDRAAGIRVTIDPMQFGTIFLNRGKPSEP